MAHRLRFYGEPPPRLGELGVDGRLIVIEGTDGVGRSTQTKLLKEWLEDHGFAVVDTGLTRSELAGPGIQRAKQGHTLDPVTLNLFYATDFCDRLERLVIPALRAGMVVLADRYIYSLIARAGVRGVPVKWMEQVYTFAAVPDRVIYLDVGIEDLVPRVLQKSGFDYWESGQDFLRGLDPYQSFIEYQARILKLFKDLALRYGFKVVNARGSVTDTFESILEEVTTVTTGMTGAARDPGPAVAKAAPGGLSSGLVTNGQSPNQGQPLQRGPRRAPRTPSS